MNLSIEFLKTDFEQCFNQMRHYDTIFIAVVNFTFAFFAAISAASIVFLCEKDPSNATYLALSFLYGIVAIIGLLILSLLLRNRCYFTFVARYVNEVRGNYLKNLNANFSNKTGLPTSPGSPRLFSPGSTQTILMYFVAIFNTVFAAGSIITFRVYSAKVDQTIFELHFLNSSIVAIIGVLIQVIWIILYLYYKDNMPAYRAWWGKNNGA